MLSTKQARQRSPSLSDNELQLLKLMEAVSDPTRYKLLKLLVAYSDMCVTDLANACGITPPAASQHLKIMEGAGLVIRTRQGQIACYHINKQNYQTKKIFKILNS